MASFVYAKTKEQLLQGGLNLLTADVRAVLIDAADYVADEAAHDFLDDVPAIARIGTPQTLGTKTATAGAFDAADASFPAVTGDPAEAVLLYAWGGTDATSRLLAYLDSGTGLPVTPNGGAINVTWDNGINRIFRI